MRGFGQSWGTRVGSLVAYANVVMLAVLFGLLATLTVSLLAAKSVSAHYLDLGADCVHNGVCHWTSVTAYEGARQYGVSEWNQLSDGTPKHYAYVGDGGRDLHFEDYKADDGLDAYYLYHSPGLDHIRFNNHPNGMPDNNTEGRYAVGVHEVGHSLRLRHPGDGWKNESIMFKCPACTPFWTYQPHDKDDYRGIW